MIPVFADSRRTRIAHSYNGLTINQHIGGSLKDIVEVNGVRVQTQVQHVREPRANESGLEVYGAFKRGKLLVPHGVIRASSHGALYDRIEEVAAAFDPDVVSRDNPDTFGFLPYDFDVPTSDTANFPSGLMPCRYYVRAEEAFEPPISQYAGLVVPFSLTLLAADSRRYLQTAQQVTLAASTAADNGLATVWSWPTLTIAMSGAGSSAFTIASTEAVASLVLNLSARSNGDSVAVDMERREITVNGTSAPELYVSGDFWHIEPGVNTITTSNATNAASTLTWRPAFSN